MERFDLVVIGAGAAGLFCAGIAGQRGLRVLLLDHAERLGEKIRISGGGRCNFTNVHAADPSRYLSRNPRFARQALASYPPQRFVSLLRRHRIGFHEKHRGQLFCDDSSQRIIDLLLSECAAGAVEIRHPVRVAGIERPAGGVPEDRPTRDDARRERAGRFVVLTDQGRIASHDIVVATGGLSIPAIGATDYAWKLAARWEIDVVAPRPGLVPLVFTAASWQPFAALAGVSLPVGMKVVDGPTGERIEAGFVEDLLFTHRGLSGPAILQVSSYWREGRRLEVDLAPGVDMAQRLVAIKGGEEAVAEGEGRRQQLHTVLAGFVPRRLARAWLDAWPPAGSAAGPGRERLGGERLAEIGHAGLRQLGRALNRWQVTPAGSEGYRKAEVTVGGVATAELDPRTMQSRRVPGVYWIGEAVDVTGWLGGYNFQWAWASAYAAAMAVGEAGSARV